MKNLKINLSKIVATLALVFVANLVIANDGLLPNVKVQSVGFGKKVSLMINDLTTETTVQLEDAAGNVLVEEKTTKPAYAKILNLSQLESGKYFLTVTMGLKTMEQTIHLTEDKAVLTESGRKEYLVPVINLKKNYVDVVLMNRQIGDVAISIIDESGKTVFEEEYPNVVKVEKRFDMSQLDRGVYSVAVTTPNDTFYKNVTNW